MRRVGGPVLALLGLAWMLGCGSGGGTPPNRTITPANQLMQLTLGDAPGDRIAAFSVPINSVTLTPSSGTPVSLLASPLTLELTHLVGTATPVATLTVPSGTYTQVSLNLGAPQITAIDPATGLAVQRTLAAPTSSVTLTLSPQFQLTTSPQVLNVEISVQKSVTLDTQGNFVFNPHLAAMQTTLATESTVGGTVFTPFNGGVDVTVGKVTTVSTSSFTIQPAMIGPAITFNVNSSTRFTNFAGISQVLSGMIVSVVGQTQADGTLLATRVSALNTFVPSAAVVGQIATVTGTPSASQFQVMELGTGAVVLAVPPPIGSPVTVALAGSTPVFGFDSTDFDFSALGFTPSFTATTVRPGQLVEVDTSSPLVSLGDTMLGLPVVFTITPAQVQLQPQGLIGTVSAFTGTSTAGTFTLTVPADSVLATLARTTTVTVFTQSKTSLVNMTAITNGSTVAVRGLLFFDSTTSSYRLVASRIMPAP